MRQLCFGLGSRSFFCDGAMPRLPAFAFAMQSRFEETRNATACRGGSREEDCLG
jgi:hypothetical protein